VGRSPVQALGWLPCASARHACVGRERSVSASIRDAYQLLQGGMGFSDEPRTPATTENRMQRAACSARARSLARRGVDLYATLGVAEDASKAEIRSCFMHEAANASAPDGDPDALASVAAAFEVLHHHDSRRVYDQQREVERMEREANAPRPVARWVDARRLLATQQRIARLMRVDVQEQRSRMHAQVLSGAASVRRASSAGVGSAALGRSASVRRASSAPLRRSVSTRAPAAEQPAICADACFSTWTADICVRSNAAPNAAWLPPLQTERRA